jgi:hypothetical protein
VAPFSIPDVDVSTQYSPLSGSPANEPSHAAFRFSALAFAALLGLQCIWLLLAELSRAGIDRLPTDAQSADIAAKQRSAATWAASIGRIRGDLWAESAFTFADLLWADPDDTSELTKSLDQARVRLDHALGYAPHLSGAWLLLAGLESRYQPSKPESGEALRMSYYTAPSELRLMPLRLLVAARSQLLSDAEIQEFVRRDLRLLLTRQQKPAVTEAYQHASPDGRRFIEQALDEIDPTFLASLRAGAQKP